MSYNNKNDLQAFQLMIQCYMQSNNQICSTCPSSQHLYEMLLLAEAAVRSIKLNARRCCLSVTLTDWFALHAGLPIMCACLASESYCSGCQNKKLCPHCPLASVGDEYHLVFECPIFQPLRDKYHTLFSSRTSSMRSFFAQKERMIVYKFVSDCLDMINT